MSKNPSPHLCQNNWKYSTLFNYQPYELHGLCECQLEETYTGVK